VCVGEKGRNMKKRDRREGLCVRKKEKGGCVWEREKGGCA